MSAGWPAATAWAWLVEGPYDCVNETSCPCEVPVQFVTKAILFVTGNA